MTFVLGLTGSIGMGKSRTAELFRARGVPVHDADACVHALYRGEAAPLIERAFPGVARDGVVDRPALAEAVLGDPERLVELEGIVHPLVRADENRFLARAVAAGAAVAILDVPLLLETGGERRCDAVVVVTAPEAAQRERVLARPGMSEAKLAAILEKQMPDAAKRRRAHFLVDTGRGFAAAERQVGDILRAAPDGYTLLAATAGTHVTAVHLMKSLPYDPVQQFTPIAAAVEPVTCLAVHAALPVNSVAGLIEYARRRPGELAFGSSGVGSVFHMLGELFNQTAGVKITHVPYRGVAPAMQDVAGGHIPMTFISVSNALPASLDGRVKILAVLEPERYAKLPHVPSISETISAFRKPSSWFGFLGPAGLPAPMVLRLNSEIVKALDAADVRTKLEDSGFAVIGGPPERLAGLIADGIERYGAIIKAAGIQPE